MTIKWTPLYLLTYLEIITFKVGIHCTDPWPHTHTHTHNTLNTLNTHNTHTHTHGLKGRVVSVISLWQRWSWAETPPESQLNSSNPSQRKEEYRGIRKHGQIPQYTFTVSQFAILSHMQSCWHAGGVWCGARLVFARLYSIVLLFFQRKRPGSSISRASLAAANVPPAQESQWTCSVSL